MIVQLGPVHHDSCKQIAVPGLIPGTNHDYRFIMAVTIVTS